MQTAFDLNLLRALDALLQERSVTHAAKRCHVTQQAMSSTLKRLREFFDDGLLVRIGRQFELTALGSALQIPIHDALLQAASVVNTKASFDPVRAARRLQLPCRTTPT